MQADSVPQVIIINAEGHVADEEDAGAQAIHGFAQLQRVEHLELGETDVDAIQVIEEVADEDEGDQAPCGLAVGAVEQARAGGAGNGTHAVSEYMVM